MSHPLGDAYLAVSRIEKKITDAGQALLGLDNEKRVLINDARQLEFAGKAEHEIFKLRYHHAVEDVRLAEKAAESAAKAHKTAKEQHDAALELLTQLEEETDEDRKAKEEENLPLVQAAQKGNGSTSEAWRGLPLESLELSEAILGKLRNPIHKHSDKQLGEITTLGGLVNLTSHSPYSVLKGISSTTSGKIEDAWMKFWETHPEYCQAPLIDTMDTEVTPDLVVEASSDITDLVKHGLQAKVLKALQAGGYETVQSMSAMLDHDDLLADVVGKKSVKNVRLAYESWNALQPAGGNES